MKKILFLILILLTGCSNKVSTENMGGAPVDEEEVIKVDHVVVWDGKDTPKSDGYQTYTRRKKDGMIKSTGVGLQAKDLDHDWKIETTATSTK